MNQEKNPQDQNYKNVMEMLVNEEIDRQLHYLPQNLLKYINRIEVATYALNRLPPLYTSCQEGLVKQKQQAKKHQSKIQETVRQAFAAVQRYPIRLCTPLMSPEEVQYEETLRELIELLPKQADARRIALKLVRQAMIANPTLTPDEPKPVQSKPPVSDLEQSQEQLRLATPEHSSSESGKTSASCCASSCKALLSYREQIQEQLRIAESSNHHVSETVEDGEPFSMD